MMEEEPAPPTWCFQRKSSIENSDQPTLTRERVSSYANHRQFGSRSFERGGGSQIDILIEQIDSHSSSKEEKILENNTTENKDLPSVNPRSKDLKNSVPYQPPPPPKKGSRFITNSSRNNSMNSPSMQGQSNLLPPPARKVPDSVVQTSSSQEVPPLAHSSSVPFVPLPKSPLPPANQQYIDDLRTVIADRDYLATEPSELSVNAGDSIILRGCPENGWCEGEVNNTTGWFPINVSDLLMEAVASPFLLFLFTFFSNY